MKIHIDMDPVPKGRPRMTRSGHTYTPQRTRDAEAHIREAVKTFMNGDPPLDGPLLVSIKFVLRRAKSNKTEHPMVRYDLDNLAKGVLDPMNGIVYSDDGQVVVLMLAKVWGESGGIDIEISPITKVTR